MNIEEYRALVQQSQEAQQVAAQSAPETPPAEPEVTQQAETQGAPETPPAETTPDYVEIEGEKRPLSEVVGGYMRQSDYTRKTQEVAKEKERLALAEQYYNAVNSNPEFAKQVAESFNLPYQSPEEVAQAKQQESLQQTLLEKEVKYMELKYQDFDAQDVISYAMQKNITDLEDAYFLKKQRDGGTQAAEPVDVKALSEQIRQQVLQELQSTVDTTTIISSGTDAAQLTQTAPELTPQELRVAQGLKLSKEEYIKFKNNK